MKLIFLTTTAIAFGSNGICTVQTATDAAPSSAAFTQMLDIVQTTGTAIGLHTGDFQKNAKAANTADADLLSEVCLCLKYLALEIPKFWDDYLSDYAGHIRVTFDESVASSLNPSVDEYHIYLVLNAYLASQGQGVFSDKFHSRAPRFSLPNTPQSLLSKLSSFAHENAFKGQKGDNSLSAFISCLGESDINHWQKSLASTELSESLVRRFSGLN